MWKAYILLWKNIFNYTGKTNRKDYWLGLLGNLIGMYIFVIPYALFFRFINYDNFPLIITAYLILINLPCLSACIRRANDLQLKIFDIILITICLPAIGAIGLGLFPSYTGDRHGLAWSYRTLMLGFCLMFIGICLDVFVFNESGQGIIIYAPGVLLFIVSMFYGAHM